MDKNEIQTVLKDAYGAAPQPIQEFVSSGAFATAIEEIRSTHSLHVDTSGIVSDEALMMLLGISTPSEFVSALKQYANLTDEQIGRITTDVNKKMFEPLRTKVPIRPSPAPPTPSTPSVTPAPTVPPPAPPPSVSTVPPAPPASPPPTPPAPAMRTMAHDVEEMKEGKMPEPFVARPTVAPQPPPPPIPSATPTEKEVHESLKQYGIDPYREPVE